MVVPLLGHLHDRLPRRRFWGPQPRATAPIFLFGSHARGDATADSDLDFLVVERGAVPTAEEWVRLRDALPPLGVPVDVIVMSDDLVRRRRNVPGSLVYTALREGRLVAES